MKKTVRVGAKLATRVRELEGHWSTRFEDLSPDLQRLVKHFISPTDWNRVDEATARQAARKCDEVMLDKQLSVDTMLKSQRAQYRALLKSDDGANAWAELAAKDRQCRDIQATAGRLRQLVLPRVRQSPGRLRARKLWDRIEALPWSQPVEQWAALAEEVSLLEQEYEEAAIADMPLPGEFGRSEDRSGRGLDKQRETKPVPRLQAQEAAILAKLVELEFDPKALPAQPSGRRSAPKQDVRSALRYTKDVMNKAWLRLRRDGRVCYVTLGRQP